MKISEESAGNTTSIQRHGEISKIEIIWACARRNAGYVERKMLRMESPGTRNRGRPKRRFMDAFWEDM